MSIRDVDPPEGEPTFVFTDIEGSSALWEAVPESMRRSLRIHDALMHAACAAQQGYAVKSEGDAFMIAFAEPRQAMGFAHLVQQTLAKMTWPSELEAAQLARGMGSRTAPTCDRPIWCLPSMGYCSAYRRFCRIGCNTARQTDGRICSTPSSASAAPC